MIVVGRVGAVGVDGVAEELASVEDAVVTVAMLPDVRLLRCGLRRLLLPEDAACSWINSAIGTGSGSWLVLTLIPQ